MHPIITPKKVNAIDKFQPLWWIKKTCMSDVQYVLQTTIDHSDYRVHRSLCISVLIVVVASTTYPHLLSRWGFLNFTSCLIKVSVYRTLNHNRHIYGSIVQRALQEEEEEGLRTG